MYPLNSPSLIFECFHLFLISTQIFYKSFKINKLKLKYSGLKIKILGVLLLGFFTGIIIVTHNYLKLKKCLS